MNYIEHQNSLKIYLYFIFVNCYAVLWNTSFKEHLPVDGHSRWLKHAGGYAVYNTINLCTCICNCWFYCS